MRSKALLGVTLPFLLTGFGPAQGTPPATDKASLSFPDAGSREVWIQAGPCTGPATDSIRPSDAVADLPLTGKSATDNVYIWDHKSGNLASTTVGALRKSPVLTLDAAAFRDVAEIKVKLDHMGQPVAAANVAVDDGRKPQTQFLDPTTKGELTFYDLKPGQVKVTATYKVKDGAQKSVTQLVDVALGKGDPTAPTVISVADDVATVAAAAVTAPPSATTAPNSGTGTAPAGAGASPPAPGSAPATGNPPGQSGGNPLGSILSYLLGLGIVAAVVYFFWSYTKKNPDAVATKLQQLGVDIPKAGSDPQQYDPVAAPAPTRPEPVQKIILPDSAPEPMTAAFAMPVMTMTGEPRLVSEQGDSMMLADGETVVGRDVGLGLSLVGESTVSRRHAQLLRGGGQVTLSDLGSTNGTYVNGVAVTSPQTLRAGDTVQFGAVRFRYEG